LSKYAAEDNKFCITQAIWTEKAHAIEKQAENVQAL